MLVVSFHSKGVEHKLYINNTPFTHFQEHSETVKYAFITNFCLAITPDYLSPQQPEIYVDQIFKRNSPIANESPTKFNFIQANSNKTLAGLYVVDLQKAAQPDETMTRPEAENLKLATTNSTVLGAQSTGNTAMEKSLPLIQCGALPAGLCGEDNTINITN